jgi:2-dehydropantoate 2-reductase
MRICVFGAGAVGGCAGAVLARAGHEVSLIGRGPHMDAIRAAGLRMIRGDDDFTVRPACPASPAEIGPQDAVILSVKAHDIGDAAEAIQPMLRPDTAVVCAQNGIPWWYFHRLGGRWDGRRLASVDAHGHALKLIGLDRAVGCVVTGAFDVTAPGVIKCGGLARYAIGEPKEGSSPRLEALSKTWNVGWFEVPVAPNLREAVWFKLLGNVSFSMICVLTGSNMASLIRDEGSLALARVIMDEAAAVCNAVGIAVDQKALAARLADSQRMSGHKPSTLVDLERGRRMEIDAIIGAVCEIGRLAKVPTPTLDMVYALVRMRAEQAGCYPANPPLALPYEIGSELPVT